MIIGICLGFFIFKNQAIKLIVYLLRYFPIGKNCIYTDDSSHVEVMTLLSKLDSKKYISVELPMDDMDLTSAESKATYKQIQNYVLEKFGFKVSTLYIAQVKKKHGLEVREHYNISKNEKQKIPQCPIEKEEAILDALKHFKMVYY